MGSEQLVSLLGIFVLIAITVVFSNNKRLIRWRYVFSGIGMQIAFALIVLKTTGGRLFFNSINQGVMALMDYQQEGATFVFSALAIPPDQPGTMGFFFAFQVLTSIIFLSSLMGILYYLGVMQWVVLLFAKAMKRVTGTSGAESLSASANIFIGQTEAPLLIRPYVKDMTQSELLCVMTGGMATVAGAVMVAYVGLLKSSFPDIGAHVLTASVMSAPAALVISKIMIPETEKSATSDGLTLEYKDSSSNVLEAATAGAEVGLRLALNVGTMLIAFISLIALANALLGWGGTLVGLEGVTLQGILGYIFAPIAFIMGAPWNECLLLGQLIGEKTVLNELVAYAHMAEMLKEGGEILSERSVLIASYALCGFANILSIGIQIAGIGAIAPERKSDLAQLGIRALIGGSMATFLTASIAGMLM